MKTQPQTSREAHEKKDKASDWDLIVSILKKEPEKDFTYKEIARQAGWWNDPNRASRRMAELVRKKRVLISKVRKCFIANSNCTAYKIAI